MREVSIKSVSIHNFKGIKYLHVDFFNDTSIRGKNATGKTSVADAIAWCLFNKNQQQETDFAVRPKDENGEDIHYVDICVELNVCVEDGEKTFHTFKKISREKWTKKRGESTAELSGNITEYTIDDFPRKKNEYEAFVSSLIPTDVFRLITDPTYFNSLKWQDQREILMKMVSTGSYADLAAKLGGFDALIPDLQVATKLDDVLKKYKGQKRQLDDRTNEVPVRIDELEKMVTNYDVESLQKRKEELTAINAGEIADRQKYFEKKRELSARIFEAQDKLSEVERRLNSDVLGARNDANVRVTELQNSIKENESNLLIANKNVERMKNRLSDINTYGGELNRQYKQAMELEMDDGALTCPYCHQPLPSDQAKAKKDEFNSARTRNLEAIRKQAKDLTAEKSALMKEIEQMQEAIFHYESDINDGKQALAKLHADMEKLPSKVDPSTDSEWSKLNDALQQMKAEFHSMPSQEVSNNSTMSEIELINQKLAAAKENENIKARIAELREEQRSLAQMTMDAEKMIDLTEQFIKAQLDYVSEQVNSKFDNVQFRLWENQYNGGMAPTCAAMVNGVNFSDLNTGEKIAAGLRIIKTLQEHYGYRAWVCIDNSEALDYYHRESIKMPNQMIWLVVSNDPSLTVCRA